jgi:hypothetical protein
MKYIKDNQKYRLVTTTIVLATLVLLIYRYGPSMDKSDRGPVPSDDIPVSHATAELLSFENKKPTWTSQKQPNGNPPLFELFSSPNIYYEGEQLVIEPCNHWQFDSVFPLRLKHIFKKKYRLQLEGYIQADETNDVTVFLHDLENEQTMHCALGQTFKTLGIEVLSFKMRTIEKDDMIINTPVVQIRDSRDRMDVELTGDTKYYDDRYDAVLEDLDGKTYVLSTVGQEVKVGESSCELKSIDAERNTVSIVLIDADRQEFYKNLRLLK